MPAGEEKMDAQKQIDDLEQAVDRLLKGDASAFEIIVNATSPRLIRYSARMLGNVADAEDAVQEAYVKAYRALLAGEFDRRSRIDTWLYRITTNASIDAKRKKKRKQTDELSDVGWDGAASADASVALRELDDWLHELPLDQQAALVLKTVEGMASSEIAEILECSEGAVEQRLVRARTTLRQRRQGHA